MSDSPEGVPKVRLQAKVDDEIFLATHTSTSEDRAVAKGFAKGGGVVLEFSGDLDTRVCAYLSDVSWICTSLKPFTHTNGVRHVVLLFVIAKFPSEREQLIPPNFISYRVKAIEVVDGLQHVVLAYE